MSDDKKQAASKPMVTVVVLRDFWPTDGTRIRKNTILDVPLDDAVLDGIESGKLARFKGEKKA